VVLEGRITKRAVGGGKMVKIVARYEPCSVTLPDDGIGKLVVAAILRAAGRTNWIGGRIGRPLK
jgi:hypothetical protein